MLPHVQNPQPQHVNMVQQQMQIQGIARGPGQTQFQFNPNANPQLQQQMQVSGMPVQQHMMHQQPQLQMGVTNPNMPQIAQNTHQQVPQGQGQGQISFTPEENQMINRMAINLAQNTPPDQLNVIRHNLQNMNPEQRQALAMQNMDPVSYFFRNHATRRFVEQRAKVAAAQRANPGMTGSGNGLMPQQPGPASQNPMVIQAQQGSIPTPQMIDPSFVGSMDQIIGQQQDALRSQKAGQVVVPASNSQAVAEQQRAGIRGTPQPPSNARIGGNELMQNPNQGPQQISQYWGNQQIQQSNTSHTPHMQGQPQVPNYGNVSTQPLHGQVGGFGNQPGRIPQQNPGMPNLTKGLKPSPQPQTAWTHQSGQPKDQNGANTSQPISQQGVPPNQTPESLQNRQKALLSKLPPHIKQHLSNLPEDAQKEWVMNFLNRHTLQLQKQRAAQQLSANQSEPPTMQGQNNQVSKQMPSAQQPIENISSNNTANNPGSAQQSVTPQQQSSGNVPGNARLPNTQPQRSQKQQQQQARNLQAAQQASITLTDEQAKQMDEQNFPVAILNGGNTLSQLPQDIKTWGQLKSWVAQNDSILPAGSLSKLRGLQGLHLAARQREHQPSQNSSSNPQGPTRVPAPTASMVPPRSVGQALPAANGASLPQSSRPNMSQSLPQPTLQEIQAAKARLPENLKGLSDEEIASNILKQRQNDLMKPFQAQLTKAQVASMHRANYQQGLQQQNSPQQFPTSNNKSNTVQPAQGQRSQPQQTPRPQPPSKDQAAKQSNPIRNTNQSSSQNQPTTKGVKRNSNDDIVEVLNSNANKQELHSQPSKTSQAAKPALNSSESTTASQDQKSTVEAYRRVQANQRPQAHPMHSTGQDANSKGLPDHVRLTEENSKKEHRLLQLIAETSQNTLARQPVMMSPQTRAMMVEKLRDAKEMVQRMEQSLPIFFKMYGDEKTTRDLIRTVSPSLNDQCRNIFTNINQRLMLVHQYRDSDFNPIDQLTITPEELDKCIKELTKYFHFIMSKVVPQRQAGPAGPSISQQSSRQPLSETTTQATPDIAPSLSAANLQEHEKAMQVARQASVQKNHSSHGGNRAPAAPTSPQPPFKLFSAQSPQGVPAKYATRPNELTQDRLTLPPNKKRKGNQAPNAAPTSAQVHGTVATKSPSQVAKAVATSGRQVPATSSSIKCSVANCQVKNNSFASQGELDKHVSEVHEPKEQPVEDPLLWSLEQVRRGLGLDENGKSKPPRAENKIATDMGEAPKMKKSASAQGAIKQETATPMTRAPTQTGPSPASNLLKTPQASTNVKTPLSDAKSIAKDANAVNSKLLSNSTKEASASPDPWAGSLVFPNVINAAWNGVSDLQGVESWSAIHNTLTPASTLSSSKSEKNSPRISDISENDAVKINLTVDNDEWMPEWFEDGLYGDMESLTVTHDLIGMDWETAFGQDETESAENGTAVKMAQGRTGDLAPSAEWLRIYTPAN